MTRKDKFIIAGGFAVLWLATVCLWASGLVPAWQASRAHGLAENYTEKCIAAQEAHHAWAATGFKKQTAEWARTARIQCILARTE